MAPLGVSKLNISRGKWMPLFFSPYSNNLLWNRLLLFFFTDLIPQIRKRDGLCLSLNFWYQSIRRENKQRPPHSLSLDPQRKLLEHTSIFIYFLPIILQPHFLGGRGSSILIYLSWVFLLDRPNSQLSTKPDSR